MRPGTRLPDRSSFAWRVLSGLTSEVSAETDAELATIRLVTPY
jgi:hypothetical protein